VAKLRKVEESESIIRSEESIRRNKLNLNVFALCNALPNRDEG